MSYHERTACRLCSGALLDALSLSPTPLANAFVKTPVPQEKFPLDVMLCSKCAHAQLKQVVDPKLLFEDYVYVSGTSPSFVQHFKEYAGTIRAKLPQSVPFIVEFGSNDGILLQALKDRGSRILGIEPAKNIAENARRAGIPTVTDFFSIGLAKQIREDHGNADAIVANNVFAHIDDLRSVVEGVKELLHPNGFFVFEVQYVKDLLDGGMFDVCYHEHASMHALSPLRKFMDTCGLEIFDVDHVPTHGGSLRVWVGRLGAGHTVRMGKILAMLVQEEETNTVQAWQNLGRRIEIQKTELQEFLKMLKQRACSIVGYGAPAKATTFMHQFELGPATLDYIVDDSSLKQGLFTPGLNVQVLPSSTLYDDETGWPDYVLVLAWNFWDQILAKHKRLREGGVHFVRPFPTLMVTDD